MALLLKLTQKLSQGFCALSKEGSSQVMITVDENAIQEFLDLWALAAPKIDSFITLASLRAGQDLYDGPRLGPVIDRLRQLADRLRSGDLALLTREDREEAFRLAAGKRRTDVKGLMRARRLLQLDPETGER